MKVLALLVVAYGSLYGPDPRDYSDGTGQWTPEQMYDYQEQRAEYLRQQEMQEWRDEQEREKVYETLQAR